MMRVASAASGEMEEESHLRISACTAWACSVVATLPVPMALGSVQREVVWDVGRGMRERNDRVERTTYHTGSYATTTFDQSFVAVATAASWRVTTSIVLLLSRS